MIESEIDIPGNNSHDSEFERILERCGEPFASGTSRDVYLIPGHSDKVLKVCKVASNVCNWAEVVVYAYAENKTYFGDIHSFSLSGKYLVMEYLEDFVEPLTGLTFPSWWQDKKRDNLGRAKDGSIKIRDYAILSFDTGFLFRF